MSKKFPRGIWFEADPGRYRVRLYRNKVSHLQGYYPTEELAIVALNELKDKLSAIPKLPRNFVPPPSSTSFEALASSVQRSVNPRTKH